MFSTEDEGSVPSRFTKSFQLPSSLPQWNKFELGECWYPSMSQKIQSVFFPSSCRGLSWYISKNLSLRVCCVGVPPLCCMSVLENKPTKALSILLYWLCVLRDLMDFFLVLSTNVQLSEKAQKKLERCNKLNRFCDKLRNGFWNKDSYHSSDLLWNVLPKPLPEE